MEKINEAGAAPRPPRFTPGPWEAGKAADGTWYVHEAAALGFRPSWAPDGCLAAVRPGEKAEGNASMIAAAPAMHGALRVAREHLAAMHARPSSSTAAVLAAIDAALAKAEPRPPSLGAAPGDSK